jgi:hypothetical protein
MAWDRLRNAVDLELKAPAESAAGSEAKIVVRVENTGTGHNFPTGFPEGRNAWVAVRAFDVAHGKELEIVDAFWKRRSVGVGYLTDRVMEDPNFPGCMWKLPAGSPDPYAWQFRAVASIGDGCPTLDLPYATALNMVVDDSAVPIDKNGKPIDRDNPLGLPQFKDLDGDGDFFDDAFLIDNRLRPMPHPGAKLELDRYSVVIPEGTVGPVAVTSVIYYQSMEAVVAKKFLGNLADTDLDHVLEPCVLKGPCDGRAPRTEPAVVEGAPPVPIRLKTAVINIKGSRDKSAPRVAIYPATNQRNAYRDAVVKISGSEPLVGIDEKSFTLTNSVDEIVPAKVAQISDFTWALFPNQVFLTHGETYTAKVSTLCDAAYNCLDRELSWDFTVASEHAEAQGDTRAPALVAAPGGSSTRSSGIFLHNHKK